MKIFICAAMALFLGACGDRSHDQAWYLGHDSDRKAIVEKCDINAEKYLWKGSDCVSAKRADNDIFLWERGASAEGYADALNSMNYPSAFDKRQ